MQFFLKNLLVVCCGFLWAKGSSLETTAQLFTWQLIENSLNRTTSSENFVIAPSEAYQLYKEVFHIEDESNETGSQDSSDESDDPYSIKSTKIPAIRKQLNTLTSNLTNEADLLSSIALVARWTFNFQIRDTHKRMFHQFGTPNQKAWIDFLRKDDTFHYSHSDQLNASILELPLHSKQIKLILILPDEHNGLEDLRAYILENMKDFNDLIKAKRKMILVRVSLPKFHLIYKNDLTEFFEQLSLKEVDKYDNVYQISNLEVNERGIGRFERTTVLFWNAYSHTRVIPQPVEFNHPFLFLITNKEGIQFFGQVSVMHP